MGRADDRKIATTKGDVVIKEIARYPYRPVWTTRKRVKGTSLETRGSCENRKGDDIVARAN